MKHELSSRIEERLLQIVCELEKQPNVAESYSIKSLPFNLEMSQIREYILVGEFGLAYETIVATIELHPFILSNKGAISLLELGLIFKYKTERKEDTAFDNR